jgi:hypothetical protein
MYARIVYLWVNVKSFMRGDEVWGGDKVRKVVPRLGLGIWAEGLGGRIGLESQSIAC